MRRFVVWGSMVLVAMAFAACGGTESPAEDVKAEGQFEELVDAAGDLPIPDEKGVEDTGIDLDLFFPEDNGPELPEMPDLLEETELPPTDVPDVEEEELPPPEPTDVGKACKADTDCETDAGCLLGFCTSVCKAGGQPVPGACDYPSEQSAWGDTFACPGDMNVCMPGNVKGKTLTCNLDSDCQEQGLVDFVCAGAFPFTEVEVAGRCLPAFNRKPAGATCLESGAKCASLLCVHPNLDESLNGICSSYCDDSVACPEGSACAMNPTFDDAGELLGYGALCVPMKGSLAACADDPGACKFGKEYCGVYFQPGTWDPAFACLETEDPYGGWLGDSCSPTDACFGPWCLFGDWANKVDPYCSMPCTEDEQCGPGMACRTVHVAPGEGVLPYGVFEVGVCLKVTDGAPCFTDEADVCQFEWSACEPLPGVFGLGTCVDGECPPDCANKPCGADDGCGNPCLDACGELGAACGAGEECLSGLCVDGVCCDKACDGSCEACNLPDTLGTCSPYAGGSDPEQECGICNACNGLGACAPFGVGDDPGDACGLCQVCGPEGTCIPVAEGEDPVEECGGCGLCNGAGECMAVALGFDPKDACAEEEATTCLTTGVCNGDGACQFWDEGTLCGEASCVGSTYAPPSACSGKGTCVAPPAESCAPYLCDEEAGACLAACDDSLQCANGSWCVDGECQALPACPVETKMICNTQLPGNTSGLMNNWSEYGCVPGVPYDGPDRIYSIKMDKPTRITLTLKEAQYDAALMLVEHACAPGIACINFADFFPAGGEETLSFDAVAGVQYHLAVDGFAAEDAGSYKLETQCCQLKCTGENPCGDDGCGGSCGTCGDGEVCFEGQCEVCADDPGGEPNDQCDAAQPLVEGANEGLLLCPEGDVDWYSVDLEAGQTLSLLLEFDSVASNLDMALYGPGCDTFVADSTSPDDEEFIQYMAKKAGTYSVLVYAPLGDQAGYSLVAEVAEPECLTDDDCANPMEVCGLYQCVEPPPACVTAGEPVCNAFIAGDTTGKAAQFNLYETCNDAAFEGPEDIYKITFPTETVATVYLSGQAFQAGLTVLEQYCAADWACVSAGKGNGPGGPAVVQFKAKPATLYYLVVEGQTADDFGTYSFDVDCCTPQCDGKVCGDDGCGMNCGICAGEQDACIDGECVCQPSCDGKVCGDDGCGGSCGECEGPQDACVEGQCVCQPTCDGKACGDDGCGGDCGACEGPQDACVDFQCVCQPFCEGVVCGDDGCGGSCGECEGPQDACVEGQCVCQPTCEGKECGDDGCGGDCGSCEGEQEMCEDFQCVCQPFCEGKECGDDGCGGECGLCSAVESCVDFACVCSNDEGFEPNNTCVAATPVTPATYPGMAICGDGDQDWYSIQVPAGKKLDASILFTHADGDLDLYLYKQGNCVGYLASSSSSNNNESISYPSSTTSNYLLRVVGFSPDVSNDYTLEVKIK